MKFTGLELLYIRTGLGALLSEYENMIVTCPDPEHYAERLAVYEQQKTEVEVLVRRVILDRDPEAPKTTQEPFSP